MKEGTKLTVFIKHYTDEPKIQETNISVKCLKMCIKTLYVFLKILNNVDSIFDYKIYVAILIDFILKVVIRITIVIFYKII